MKLRFLSFLFVLISCLIVVGCSSDNSDSVSDNNNSSNDSQAENDESQETAEVVELDFWDMSWGPTEYIDAAKNIVEQFNEEHPNIQVTYQSTPWSNWYQTFSTAIASGTAPDISTGAGFQAFEFYNEGAIMPIDDVIEGLELNQMLRLL